jgi:hypothetical protein
LNAAIHKAPAREIEVQFCAYLMEQKDSMISGLFYRCRSVELRNTLYLISAS